MIENEINISELVFGPSVETRIKMNYAEAMSKFNNTATNYIKELESMKTRLLEREEIGMCRKCKEWTSPKDSCCGVEYVEIY